MSAAWSFVPNGSLPNAANLPGGCTRDLVHRFYQEQYQLNDGQQNRYMTGSDAVGLTMGYYNTQKLPIYTYLHRRAHPHYAIADNFFQAAFGGSFLNHQWLIAAATPACAGAARTAQHAILDSNGMPNKYAALHADCIGRPARSRTRGSRTSAAPEPGSPAATTPSTRSSRPISRSRPGPRLSSCRR